jgi:putative transposase
MTPQRRCCLVVIEAGSRYVHILAVTAHPDEPWTTSRSALSCQASAITPRTSSPLVRDRAGQLTASFDAALAGAGSEAVQIPPPCPSANASAERFALTARTQLTDRMLIFGERHLRLALESPRV